MPIRYIAVILVYIGLYYSNHLFQPLLVHLFSISYEEAFAYGRIIGFSIAFLLILLLMKRDLKEEVQNPNVTIKNVLKWSIIGYSVLVGIVIATSWIESEIFLIQTTPENVNWIKETVHLVPLYAICTSFFAPIMEEVLIRKIVFNSLRKRLNLIFAMLLSSLLFAVLHGDWLFLLSYTASGMVFAFIYVKSRTLLVPILVHILNNSIALIPIFFMLYT